MGLRFSPEGVSFSPEGVRFSPEGLRFSPEGLRFSPESLRFSPEGLRFSPMRLSPRGGGGLLPYMGYIGMCGPKGYGFSAVLVINRGSIIAILPSLWS